MDYFLFLSSADSKEWFPQNNAQCFTIKLPTPLKLDGNWKCALTEIAFTPKFSENIPKEIYICTKIVQDSYAVNSSLPLLRKLIIPDSSFQLQWAFPQNFYIEVSQEEIQYLKIYIKDQNLQNPSFLKEPLTCTLHLCKV